MSGVCFYGYSFKLPYDAKINVGCMLLRSEINYNSALYEAKIMSGVCFYGPKLITVTFSSV